MYCVRKSSMRHNEYAHPGCVNILFPNVAAEESVKHTKNETIFMAEETRLHITVIMNKIFSLIKLLQNKIWRN